MGKDAIESVAGAMIVNKIIRKFRKLVENDVLLVARELRAFVVDLLDIALGPRRADDVRRIGDPLLEPVKAFATHAGRKHGNPAATENPRNCNTAAAVMAGRRPYCPVTRRVDLPGDEPRHETGVGGKHLVGADHRKASAE